MFDFTLFDVIFINGNARMCHVSGQDGVLCKIILFFVRKDLTVGFEVDEIGFSFI